MQRRSFLAALGSVSLLPARNHIGLSRLSVITDEIAASPAAAIEFARKYGLRWVELRSVPGKRTPYTQLEEAELKTAARELKEAGLGVSFLNTDTFKYTLPGTTPARPRTETPEARDKRIERDTRRLENRADEMRKAVRAAHIFGVDQMRIFTFTRVVDPASVEQRVADLIGEMVEIAAKAKVRALIENEGSCNVATCAEMASMMKLLPSKWAGVNWDPMNGMAYKETPFPNGYDLLPKKRIHNVQVKGRTLLDPQFKLDWRAMLNALAKDGYRGKAGLETHYGKESAAQSHPAIQELMRAVES